MAIPACTAAETSARELIIITATATPFFPPRIVLNPRKIPTNDMQISTTAYPGVPETKTWANMEITAIANATYTNHSRCRLWSEDGLADGGCVVGDG